VLPTYNERDSIRAAILDFAGTDVVDEILVINNNAAPGTSDEVVAAIDELTNGTLVREIHDRMPVIIPHSAYDRWLSSIEPDPRDLLVPFPAELMRMWPISSRVNKPENDEEHILDALEPEATKLL